MHGGDIYRNKVQIDFSVNVNPLGPRPEVMKAVCNSAEEIHRYPDILCERLVEEISLFERVDKNEIMCANGAAELFFAVVLAVRPKEAVVLSPGFSEYERALGVVDAKVVRYYLKSENQFRLYRDFLEYITETTDMVFLCNPNNPTGQTIERELLEEIAERCERFGTVLVVDECFTDFLDCPQKFTMKNSIEKYKTLMITKAFTKLFCMPGLRLGYALNADPELLGKMRDVLQPWNVSVPAQKAGIAALKECAGYVEKTRQVVKQERAFLKAALQDCGFRVYGSEANYLFFYSDRSLYEEGLKEGVLIRDCSDYPGLGKGYYRIAVKEREDNERLIRWLKKL